MIVSIKFIHWFKKSIDTTASDHYLQAAINRRQQQSSSINGHNQRQSHTLAIERYWVNQHKVVVAHKTQMVINDCESIDSINAIASAACAQQVYAAVCIRMDSVSLRFACPNITKL